MTESNVIFGRARKVFLMGNLPRDEHTTVVWHRTDW